MDGYAVSAGEWLPHEELHTKVDTTKYLVAWVIPGATGPEGLELHLLEESTVQRLEYRICDSVDAFVKGILPRGPFPYVRLEAFPKKVLDQLEESFTAHHYKSIDAQWWMDRIDRNVDLLSLLTRKCRRVDVSDTTGSTSEVALVAEALRQGKLYRWTTLHHPIDEYSVRIIKAIQPPPERFVVANNMPEIIAKIPTLRVARLCAPPTILADELAGIHASAGNPLVLYVMTDYDADAVRRVLMQPGRVCGIVNFDQHVDVFRLPIPQSARVPRFVLARGGSLAAFGARVRETTLRASALDLMQGYVGAPVRPRFSLSASPSPFWPLERFLRADGDGAVLRRALAFMGYDWRGGEGEGEGEDQWVELSR